MPRQHLTPNACLVCRRKRTKCDGQMPCRRCRSRGEECVYEDKKWRTKDHLRSEIERLRAEQRQGHALIRALTDNDPKQWETILDRLRNDDSPDSIAEWIHSTRCASGPPHPPSQALVDNSRLGDASPRLCSPFRPPQSLSSEPTPGERVRAASFSSASTRSFSQTASSVDGMSRTSFSADFSPASHFSLRDNNTAFPPLPFTFAPSLLPIGIPQLNHQRSAHSSAPPVFEQPILHTWTNVTSDKRLVERLLASFFSGSFHSLSLISQPQFVKDFCAGNSRFCSEALVNAILGSACKYFDTTSQLISRVTFGDAFFAEAKRLLAVEHSNVSLPSIQALGVLALAEMSQGNDTEAWDLAQESVRASIHLALQTRNQEEELDGDFRAVRALVYCGGFSLIRVLQLLTGHLEPKAGPLFMRLQPHSPYMGEDSPEARVERGIALQMQFFAELQYCPPLTRFIFEVTEVVHTFLTYNFSKATSAEDLEGAYDKCLGYYRQFTELSAPDMDSTPDLIFAQIWYHCCLLNLLGPFVGGTASLVDGVPPRLRDGVTPKLVCQQASEAIVFLTSTYQTHYTLGLLPPLLPHMVFAAVLYQLTLAIDSQQASHHQQAFARSPVPMSPRTTYEAPQHPKPSPLWPPQMSYTPHASSPSFCISHPLSPTVNMQMQRAARRASGLSTTSTCDSGGVSDREEASQSDASSEMLPTFTSDPADLVTIGSLQLGSMGAQHPGAAEAARLLRSLGTAKDFARPGLNSATSMVTEPFCFPSDKFGGPPTMTTGLGFQEASSHGGFTEAEPTNLSANTAPGPGQGFQTTPSSLSVSVNQD
ncbi:putative C6-zinc finger TF, regulator of conidiation [Podospora didyma]|uniref:C6-zinc finger TF, regulator of conidiation n=1 Tax=Podospora didyma TaxID=330526 RepID=A0AAE0NUC2_9PEZI|nr:putative C6-zinc finger TF, regulator of conidiation [Podospora didyma]